MMSSESTFILCGGGNPNDLKIFNHVFLGEVENEDVKWKPLKKMSKGRVDHISFLMNENLYVAGGHDGQRKILKDCEMYDLKEGNWNNSVHELPFQLTGAVVAMSKDSSYAIITGGRKVDNSYNKAIITFTEQEGFKVLKKVSTQFERVCGVSMVL